MAVDEEAPLTGGNYTATERVSLRGSARVFLSALLLFTVSAFSAKSLFPRGRASTTTSQSLATEEEVVLLVEEDAIVVEGEELTTLAPVRVTTAQCTGDLSLPAVRGVDVVAYFSLAAGQPAVYGLPQFSTVYHNYHFFFSSAENQEAFKADPKRYVPAWGGFCSYGISHEIVWNAENLGPKSNPDYWLIVDDRLYLFRSSIPLGKFTKHLRENVAHGTQVWDTWFGDLAKPEVALTPFDTACFCTVESCVDA